MSSSLAVDSEKCRCKKELVGLPLSLTLTDAVGFSTAVTNGIVGGFLPNEIPISYQYNLEKTGLRVLANTV